MSLFENGTGNTISGEIWSSQAMSFESPLKDLLDTGQYTLHELLAEDELLQELRGSHPQLIAFFSCEESVTDLVRCLLASPPRDGSEMDCPLEVSASISDYDEDQEDIDEKYSTNNINSEGDHDKRSDDNKVDDSEYLAGSEAAEMNEEIIDAEAALDPAQYSNQSKDTDKDNDENTGASNIHLQFKETKQNTGNWLYNNVTEQTPKTSTLSQQEEYERLYIRYPYMACEVICCEIGSILDILVDGHVPLPLEDDDDDSQSIASSSQTPTPLKTERQSILDLLFTLLTSTPPSELDDRRAGYLEKILSVLFRRKPLSMASYMNGDHLILPPPPPPPKEQDHDGKKIQNEIENQQVQEDQYKENQQQDQRTNHQGGGIPLLKSFFLHLNSHSIMQIMQRLLMPHPPSSAVNSKNNQQESPENNGNNTNGNQMNGSSSSSHGQDEDNEDEYGFIGGGMGLLRCNWAESDIALQLLISKLVGVGCIDGDSVSFDVHKDEENETRIECSQHASEILITMIQNSQLTSNIMRVLSSDPVLEKIVLSACGSSFGRISLQGEGIPLKFSMHESTMTTAMSVLESLVLQLGGYGAVPTPACNGVAEDEGGVATKMMEMSPVENNICDKSGNNNIEDNVQNNQENAMQNQVLSSSATLTSNTNDKNNDNQESLLSPAQSSSHSQTTVPVVSSGQKSTPILAKPDSLINHLPNLLITLSSLLTHPDTSKWESPVQYSAQPQKLLGTSRLRIVRLIESLVLLGNKEVDHILCQSNCLAVCLELFWKFTWCSMLHQSVANLLVHVLEGGEDRSELQKYFLNRCNLPRKLMDSFYELSSSSDEDALQGTLNAEGNVRDNAGGPSSSEDNTNINEGVKIVDTGVIDSGEENITGPRYSEEVLAMKNYRLESAASSSVDAELGSNTSSDDLGLDDSDNEDEDVIPVSDDDVDVAMEQQEQLDKLNTEDAEIVVSATGDTGMSEGNEVGESSAEDICMVEPDNDASEKISQKDGSENERSQVDLSVMSAEVAESTECQIPPSSNEISDPKVDLTFVEMSFRMGYMGHVIIICQALVQACSSVNSKENEEALVKEETNEFVDLEVGSKSETKYVKKSLVEDVEQQSKDGPLSFASDDKKDTITDGRVPVTDNSVSNNNESIECRSNAAVPSTLSRPLDEKDKLNISSLLQVHPLHEQWQSFVSTTLASETAVQSTALGGYNNEDSNSNLRTSFNIVDDQIGEDDNNNSSLGGGILGDLDDTDLDIAANMMAALRFQASESAGEEDEAASGSSRHHRQKGVIAGTGTATGSGFGTVVQMNTPTDGYFYDDPLGGGQNFDTSVDNDVEDERDSGSQAFYENEDNDGDDEDVPVMDLFTGNLTFDDSGSNNTATGSVSNDDATWANFANFDDAFAASANDNEVAPADFGSAFGDEGGTELFAVSNASDIIDNTTDLFGTAGTVTTEDLFGISDNINRDFVDGVEGEESELAHVSSTNVEAVNIANQ